MTAADSPPENEVPPAAASSEGSAAEGAATAGGTAEKPSFVARTRAFIDASRARALATVDQLEKRRPGNRLIDAVFGSVETDLQTGGDLLAGAVAFRLFLFFVPYVMFIILGFGFLADLLNREPRDFAGSSGMSGLVAKSIESGTQASHSVRIITFLIVLYAMFSGARKLLKALRTAHSLIWKLPFTKLRRPYAAAGILILVVSVSSALAQLIAALRDLSFIGWLVGLVLYSLIPAGLWLLCSLRAFPSAPGTTWRDLWPGAALVGAGLQLLHVVTVVWITHSLESKSETYGALGAALTILLWAYMLGRVMTSAVALNAAMWTNAHREVPPS